MKVLFISSGNAVEGISPIIKNQGESLKKTGIDLYYFTIKGKGFISYIKHIYLLRKFLRYDTFDVFHAHYSLSAFTASLSGCKPLVVSLMGSDTKSGFLLQFLIKILTSLYWERVIVKSFSMKKDINIKKVEIIPNGVDLDLVYPIKIRSVNSSEKMILFAADPGKYVKNFHLAEEALSLLDNKQCILKVIHSKPHNKIIREINNADVLLLTSLWEGSPNIIKEAMSCNCPIVSTNVGDVEWLFGNEPGHFVTTFDPGDIAEKINQALIFAEKNNRTNGRQRIIKLSLDSESIANRIIEIYHSVL